MDQTHLESLNPKQNAVVQNLIARLLAIRERLFLLAAYWATTLSPDIAYEADGYRKLFHDLANELRKIDPDAVEALTVGHEALLLAEPTTKPSIPLATQQLFELACEARREPRVPPQPRSQNYDGLDRFV